MMFIKSRDLFLFSASVGLVDRTRRGLNVKLTLFSGFTGATNGFADALDGLEI